MLLAASQHDTMKWLMIPQRMLELISGVVMMTIVAGLLVFRLPELRQCWMTHRRIKFYLCLSCTAIAVNLIVGAGGVMWMSGTKDPRIIVAGWCAKHIHITLDTLVLYGTLLKVTSYRSSGSNGQIGASPSSKDDQSEHDNGGITLQGAL